MEILIVTLASLFAGMVDSIVGGGGLILIPALFATFPTAAPATLVGTNKSAAIWGTAFSTYQFSKKWRCAGPLCFQQQRLAFWARCVVHGQ